MENLQKDSNVLEENNNIQQQTLIDKVSTHVDTSINQMRKLMKNYISNFETIENADKLAYWLEDYCRFLNFEKTFNPNYLKKYERGDIIKVNLGYNIGNEEGGLHYCVVLDKNNAKGSGIITVAPLTSYKGKPLHFSSVFIGNEIYTNFKEKYDTLILQLSSKINSMNLDKASQEEIASAFEDLNTIKKMDEEMLKMKKGSVVLVSQITTISKQRIYDPQRKNDILAGLKLSDTSLDLINEKIKQLYIKI